jgi:nuclear GTP-binding protein
MPKTGWKYTKQMPSKGKTNMLKKSAASSKIGRSVDGNNTNHVRSQETIKRLKMYVTGKAIRNKEGKVVGGSYLMKSRAGDTEITKATGKIAPDRRWFGNTRVVDPKQLDTFRREMAENKSDPYSIVLKRKQLPIGLLKDLNANNDTTTTFFNTNDALLTAEPFQTTFGSKSTRKRVKIDQFLISRQEEQRKKKKKQKLMLNDGDELAQQNHHHQDNTATTISVDTDEQGYAALLQTAQKSQEHYDTINKAEGIVPWGRDSFETKTEGQGVDWFLPKKDDLFLKGQSKRIWGEFFKVVDSSDVILHVIDARNVPGTRCTMIENHISKNAPHKHLIFVLNKIDLVPNWVAKRWVGELSQVRPTIAFHASSTNQAFGKGALITLLRQFSKLMSDKKQISCGVIGKSYICIHFLILSFLFISLSFIFIC